MQIKKMICCLCIWNSFRRGWAFHSAMIMTYMAYVYAVLSSSEWMAEIVRTMADTGSQWTKENAYGSYAPQRQNVPVQWYG